MQDTNKIDDTQLTHIWRFDPEEIVPGDVVLECGHGLTSLGIRLFDWGRYSHALIKLDRNDFLEAVGTGVRSIGIHRFLIRDPKDWMVLRHPDPEVGAKAALEARAFAHMFYDRDGAIATKIPGKGKESPVAMFCSQVVATAYARAGAPLVDKQPHRVTPNGLRRQSVLVEVKPIPLVKQALTPGEAVDAAPLLNRDQAYAGTDMSHEMALSQEVLPLIRGLFPAITVPPELNVSCPPRNLGEAFQVLQLLPVPLAMGISDIMLPALEERGYFDFGQAEMGKMVERLIFQKAQLATNMMDTQSMVDWGNHYAAARKTHIPTVGHHSRNAEVYAQLLSGHGPLPIYDRMIRMHRAFAVTLSAVIKLEEAVIDGCAQGLAAAGVDFRKI